MIRRLFTDVADAYDRMNRLLSLGLDAHWRTAAVALVPGEPRRILDLACGTGDLTFALARRFPRATLLGLDLTPTMLDLARAKNAFPNVTFREGDAQRLPFARSAFDLVTCAFGFRNFPDKSAALGETRRTLTDGGELLVLEFFRPRHRLLGAATAAWVRTLARLFSGGRQRAYAYLTDSMRTTISEDEFIALAAAHGFTLAGRRFHWPCCSCLRFRIATSRKP